MNSIRKTSKHGKTELLLSLTGFAVLTAFLFAVSAATAGQRGITRQEAAETALSGEELSDRENPAREHEIQGSEDGNLPAAVLSGGIYLNRRLAAVETGFGMSLRIGLENPELRDALYINPHFVSQYAGNPNEQYGYLLRTQRVPLEYARTEPAPGSDPGNAGTTDLAVLGRTFDLVVPASTENEEQYGVRWRDSAAYGGKPHDGDRLHILAVRLSDGSLMGAATADIVYREAEDAYCIENFRNSDVRYSGDLTEVWREALRQRAGDFLEDGNGRFSLGFSDPGWRGSAEQAVVEKTEQVYFDRLFSAEGRVIPAGRYKNCDIYAAHINCSGYGYFTVYFAPESALHGLHAAAEDKSELTVIGYDAFAPMTAESLRSHLLPEDAEALGIIAGD